MDWTLVTTTQSEADLGCQEEWTGRGAQGEALVRGLTVVCRVLRHSGWGWRSVALAQVADRVTVAMAQANPPG